MKLAIVESPSKSSTVESYLGSDFKVLASKGHIRDLCNGDQLAPKHQNEEWSYLGVNTEDGFEPFYTISDHAYDTIETLRRELAKADELYLATDEDREGEAISWHLTEVLDPSVPVHRMTFNEITKSSIQQAIQQAGEIDDDLVASQEARRILDRLVGYPISNFLSRHLKFGLTAGRVQVPAVRLIVEREKTRRAFQESTYWDLTSTLDHDELNAKLMYVDDDRVADGRDFDSETGAYQGGSSVAWLDEGDVDDLLASLDTDWLVEEVVTNEFTSSPKPPYVTSTLQRAASRKLNMSASYTMSVAQSLYENGHITYMRTDDPSLSSEGISGARKAAYGLYGDEYVHDHARQYSSGSSAQGAHEAIRPTGDTYTHPNQAGLSGKQYQLYKMIWQRAVASQMADAEKTSIRADLHATSGSHELTFRTKGQRVDFAGYIGAYYMGANDLEDKINENNAYPDLDEGGTVSYDEVQKESHTTQPPSRYTEPSLIKALKEKGIGRPSTYATIMDKITKDGRYARQEGKTMIPTWAGIAMIECLKEYMPDIASLEFTARMENNLDRVASGDLDRTAYLSEFWSDFESNLDRAGGEIDESVKVLEFENLSYDVHIGYYGPYISYDVNGDQQSVSIPDDIDPDSLTDADVERLIEEDQQTPDPIAHDPDTGLGIYLKDGSYGEYLQRGLREEDDLDDPDTANIPDAVDDPSDLDLQTILNLFDLPITLGEHDGKPIVGDLGPYGPYLKMGEDDPSYENLDSFYGLFDTTLDEAIDRFEQQYLKDFGEHPDTGDEMKVIDGPYGPYLKLSDDNIGIPDDWNLDDTTREDIIELIDEESS